MPSYGSFDSSVVFYEIVFNDDVVDALFDAEQILQDIPSNINLNNIRNLLSNRPSRRFERVINNVRRSNVYQVVNYFSASQRRLAEVERLLIEAEQLALQRQAYREYQSPIETPYGYQQDILSPVIRAFSDIVRNELQSIQSLIGQITNVQTGRISLFESDFVNAATGIVITFNDGSRYQWNEARIGSSFFFLMVSLAEAGDGLGSFINRRVRTAYSEKQ